MVLAELFSLALYLVSLFFFRQWFGELRKCPAAEMFLIRSLNRLGIHLDDGVLKQGLGHHRRLLRTALHPQVPPSEMLAAFLR